MKFKILFFSVLLLLIFGGISAAQDNSYGKPNVSTNYFLQNIDFSSVSNTDLSHPVQQIPQRVVTQQETQLLAEQRIAKIAGDQQRVLELDRQLDNVRGVTKSEIPGNGGAYITQANTPPFYGGDVNTTMIHNGLVKGLATATEQVGANAGRIWVFVMRDTAASVVDRGTLYYSDNGGASWNAYLFLTLGGTDKFMPNTGDMEIIEGATGDKFMWVSYGWAAGSQGGAQKVGLMAVNITTFAGGVYGLAWPGNDNAKRYYRPRIASDNPSWAQTSTWLFIACSFDSAAGPGWDNHQKYAEIHNPTNVTTATVTYQGPMFSWYMGTPTDNFRRDLHTDIVYWRNAASGDSVMVSFSNIRDSTRIFLAASSEGTYSYNPATRTGTNSNYHQMYVYSFSPGSTVGQNLMMTVRRNFTNNGDWDSYYYRSTNGCIPGSAWSSGYIDGFVSTTNVPWGTSIYGKRGVLDFRAAYTYDNATQDSVMYSAFTASWSAVRRVSYIDSNPIIAAPRPALRTGGGDDCFIAWANYAATQVWSSRLCNTTVGVNNNNNSIPHEYSLSQNYPNPFNPSTSISFGIPQAGLVKLSIYDITGKLVATLLNGEQEAGNYNVVFDASNFASGMYFYKIEAGQFTSTKKMVLVK